MRRSRLNLSFTALSAMAALALGMGIAGTSALASNADQGETIIDKPFLDALRQHAQRRFLRRIEATAEQRQKISAILEQRFEDLKPLRQEIRGQTVDLLGLMADSNTSDDQLKAKMREIKDLRAKLMDERMSTALQVRALMTPEQRQKVTKRLTDLLTGKAGLVL